MPTPRPKLHCSYEPLAAPDVASFLPKAKEGANSYVASFMVVATMLLENYRDGFTVNEAFQIAQSQGLPPAVTKSLFCSFTEKMVKAGQLKAVKGAYDDTVFTPV